ncbi:hypothetical protein DOY81_008525 [Sarcophaga bullata]|nr:hypothetical protein DOY81_008525 [Sarcophaga bullata]
MTKNKKWYNEEASSCRQVVFSDSNQEKSICNRYTHKICKPNETKLVVCTILALFIFPYHVEGFPPKFEDRPYNDGTAYNDENFNFLTTEISPFTTNIYEDDMISSTIYHISDISSIHNSNKNENFVKFNDNNIITPNERNIEVNSAEDLEQSIRSSVKFEIETNKRLESSQVMEILKDLADPEMKKTLSDDIISLDNFNQNKMDYFLHTEHTTLLNNEIFELPKSEDNLKPETNNMETSTGLKSLAYGKEMNKTEEVLLQARELANTESIEESMENLSNLISNKQEVKNMENVLDKTRAEETHLANSDTEKNYDKLNNSRNEEKSKSVNQFFNSKVSSLLHLETPKTSEFLRNVANVDSRKSENKIFNAIEEDSNSSNVMLSVTLHEAIAEIPINSKEHKALNIEEYNSSTEQFSKEIDNNTIDAENVKHVIIKKVLNVQENTNVMSETTPHPKLSFSGDIISSCLQLEKVLKNYPANMNINNQSIVSEKFNNQVPKPKPKLINESMFGDTKNHVNGTSIEMLTSVYIKPNIKNNTEQYLNTKLIKKSELNTSIEGTKEYSPQIEPSFKLKDSFFNSSLHYVNKPAENITSGGIKSSNIEKMLNELKEPSSAKTEDSSTKLEDAVATLFEVYPPQDVEQTFNDNLADELSDIRKTLAVSFIDGSSRSTIIIILCSTTAFLFILISIIIFLISFQRQNGTLNIEMQERSCGKDNLDEEDAQTFAMLLDVEFSQFTSVALDETDECL